MEEGGHAALISMTGVLIKRGSLDDPCAWGQFCVNLRAGIRVRHL